MSKSKLSIVVVLCTVFSVIIMIINSKPELINNSMKSIYSNTKKLTAILNDRFGKGDAKNYSNKKEDNTQMNSKQTKTDNSNHKNNSKSNTEDEIVLGNSGIKLTLKEVRENKLNLVKENIIEDMQDYYDSKNAEENKDIPVNSSVDTQKSNVNKNLNSNTIDNDFKGLSSQDKDRILSAANSLSALDNAKINEYIEKNSITGVADAFKLLKERLSDKDYEKLKPLEDKYLDNNRINEDKAK